MKPLITILSPCSIVESEVTIAVVLVMKELIIYGGRWREVMNEEGGGEVQSEGEGEASVEEMKRRGKGERERRLTLTCGCSVHISHTLWHRNSQFHIFHLTLRIGPVDREQDCE